MPRQLIRTVVALALVAGSLGIASAPASRASASAASGFQPRCPATVITPGLGPTCRGGDGALHVYSRDGRDLGPTHGMDPVPSAGPIAAEAAPLAPACAAADDSYRVVTIYAHAYDDTDAFSTTVDPLRSVLASMNGTLNEAAVAAGTGASFEFECDGSGALTVHSESLPTAARSASFSTIVADLQARGYDDTQAKYLVYYDDRGACACAGTGQLYLDDSPGAGNANNGNGLQPLFAVDFGYLEVRTLMHELGHTLGAVQTSAPHTTGAGHCIDGLDIMCYADGGPNSSWYSAGWCAAMVFDCAHDDYFSTAPAPGSYLTTHWNIADAGDRYIEFHGPRVTSFTCPSGARAGDEVVCSATADDLDTPNLIVQVDWNDGTTSTVPALAGEPVDLPHTFATKGDRVVSLQVSDDEAIPVLTKPLQRTIAAFEDVIPPTITVNAPVAGTVYRGCSPKQNVSTAILPTYLASGCVSVMLHDADSGLGSFVVLLNGDEVVNLTEDGSSTATHTTSFPLGRIAVNVPLRITATDRAGNATTVTVAVNAAG